MPRELEPNCAMREPVLAKNTADKDRKDDKSFIKKNLEKYGL